MENNIAALLLNNIDKRIKLSGELKTYCQQHEGLNSLLADAGIPSSVRIKETELEHKPINILHPGSKSHLAYKDVYNELMDRGIL
jgi:cellulose biosynthesis protein BcsQ